MDGKDPCAETACVLELSGIVCPLGAIVIYPSHDQKKAGIVLIFFMQIC